MSLFKILGGSPGQNTPASPSQTPPATGSLMSGMTSNMLANNLQQAYIAAASSARHTDSDYERHNVYITKVEDGYIIEVTSSNTSFHKKYIAKDVNELTDNIKRALVESKLTGVKNP